MVSFGYIPMEIKVSRFEETGRNFKENVAIVVVDGIVQARCQRSRVTLCHHCSKYTLSTSFPKF